jgi:hypothetical protein
MAILFASARAFANDNVDFLRRAAANEFERKGFANRFTTELRVNIFEACDGMAGERDENVSDDDSRFVRGAFRLDFQDNSGGLFCALEGLAEGVRQTNGLQADAEIALRDVALFQQGVDDVIDSARGNGDGPEASEARGRDANGAALRIDHGAADGGGL